MQWNDILDPTRNVVTAGSIYPADGGSISGASTGPMAPVSVQGGGGQAAPQLPAGSLPAGLLVFAALVAITMFVVHKWGAADSDFANIRASAYNIFIIALIAVVGIPVLKIGFYQLAQMNVPLADHAWTWVQTA